MIELRSAWMLILLLIIPLLVWLRLRRGGPVIKFSSIMIFERLRPTWRMRLRFVPFVLRMLALALVIVALAGPRKTLEQSRSFADGIDIVLLLDVSTSMAAEDFEKDGKRINRLNIVKDVVSDFISKREHDRVGLVAFAAEPHVVCPLTMDQGWLKTNLERIDFGIVEDGTAIGSAIMSGTNRLRKSQGRARVSILLTDGVNNAGSVDPLTAAKAAQALGVKIYTVGAGTQGFAPYPVRDIFGRKAYQKVPVEIDEAVLQEVAQTTGGQYFRATDTRSLEQIYEQIDKMEKVKVEEVGYRQYQELFVYFLLGALALILIEVVIGRTLLLELP